MPKQKKEKYTWAIGKPLPDLDEHSQAKHRIISDYIQRYVEVYMSNTSIEGLRLSIVDGFSGGGKYRDILTNETVDGSPFVILNAIKEVEERINKDRIKRRSIDAHYFFIDCIKQHTEFLKNEIQQSAFRKELDENIFLHTDIFARAAPSIIDEIHKRNKAQRCLFILDQYAYKDVPFNTVHYILEKLKGSEVILTFNVNALMNYFSEFDAIGKSITRILLKNMLILAKHTRTLRGQQSKRRAKRKFLLDCLMRIFLIFLTSRFPIATRLRITGKI